MGHSEIFRHIRETQIATITKRGDGQWQAKVRKKGYKIVTKTLPTKANAEKWARLTESEMDRGIFLSTTQAETTLLSELLAKYAEEIAPTLKSHKTILSKIKMLDIVYYRFIDHQLEENDVFIAGCEHTQAIGFGTINIWRQNI